MHRRPLTEDERCIWLVGHPRSPGFSHPCRYPKGHGPNGNYCAKHGPKAARLIKIWREAQKLSPHDMFPGTTPVQGVEMTTQKEREAARKAAERKAAADKAEAAAQKEREAKRMQAADKAADAAQKGRKADPANEAERAADEVERVRRERAGEPVETPAQKVERLRRVKDGEPPDPGYPR